MPTIHSANFCRYTATKLIELFLILIGFGLLHFVYEQEGNEGSVLTFHGGVIFLTTVNLILFIGKVFKREPSAKAYLVINLIGFIFFAIIGIHLLCRAVVMSYKHKAQPFLGYYNEKRPGNNIFSPLANRKTYIPHLLAGIFAILNALSFMAENILVYLPQLHFLVFKNEQNLKHGARNRTNRTRTPNHATIPEQDEEAEY